LLLLKIIVILFLSNFEILKNVFELFYKENMKKSIIGLLVMLTALSPLFSLEYDLGGQWVKEGSVEYYDFDPQNPASSDGNLLYFQNDYENRQYVVIDTNKILYRISIDSGKTVSSFKLPNVVEIDFLPNENYMYKLGNKDSIFITVLNTRYDSSPSLRIKIYNIIENKVLLDTYAYADYEWGCGTTLLSVEFLEYLNSIVITYKVKTLIIKQNCLLEKQWIYTEILENQVTTIFFQRQITFMKPQVRKVLCLIKSIGG